MSETEPFIGFQSPFLGEMLSEEMIYEGDCDYEGGYEGEQECENEMEEQPNGRATDQGGGEAAAIQPVSE